MPDPVRDRLAALIDELFGLPRSALTDDVDLQDGLQLDSLSVLELQTAVEDAFEVRFDEDRAEDVTTYGTLVDAVHAALDRRSQSA